MRWILAIWMAGAVYAQGTTPKRNASEYPVNGKAGDVEIGAEFMVHSFSRGEASYIAQDYLVVEVALYPPKGAGVAVDPARFSLRINGKKQALVPQSPSMVAASLTHPEWQSGPQLEAGAGVGNAGVILGPPRSQTPYPVPGGGGQRLPRPPQDNASGVESAPRDTPEEILAETALPVGKKTGPVSGYLYFAYQGKLKSIKTLEMLYEGTALRLR